jgi:hAT family C-terminal dimerisation region
MDLCLTKVRLSEVKIFACTTDTTANMNAFGIKLERMGIAHFYCTDHVLQLTCKLCYTETKNTFGEPYNACEMEFGQYLSTPSLPGEKKEGNVVDGYSLSDRLQWWANNQRHFPILAPLAKCYLAVQATSAPSERIFSVASRLVSARRNRMSPSMAGKALFVSENWKWFEEQGDIIDALSVYDDVEGNVDLDEEM